MNRSRSWLAALPLLWGVVLAASCGARSQIPEPESVADPGAGGGGAAPAEHACLPNCTVGHRCCVGGCDGPAAATVNDCCACLPGEVSSGLCADHTCGGGECKFAGAACQDESECCSGHCDYPDSTAEKKNCLLE